MAGTLATPPPGPSPASTSYPLLLFISTCWNPTQPSTLSSDAIFFMKFSIKGVGGKREGGRWEPERVLPPLDGFSIAKAAHIHASKASKPRGLSLKTGIVEILLTVAKQPNKAVKVQPWGVKTEDSWPSVHAVTEGIPTLGGSFDWMKPPYSLSCS